jgi:hypothetical protein
MSGPNLPGSDSGSAAGDDRDDKLTPEEGAVDDIAPAGEYGTDLVPAEFPSRAYSAPESEQYTPGPYVPADLQLYDYDNYDGADAGEARPPRWP